MIVEELRKRITQAMRDHDDVAKDVLRVALGEIQTEEHRANAPLSDEKAVALVRKLVKSNEETMAASTGDRAATLKRENEILSMLLPQRMSIDAIVAELSSQVEVLRGAKNDGQATGLAMKHLKTTGAAVDGADVTEAVKRLRG